MTFQPLGVGKIIALVVFLLAIIFLAIGKLGLVDGGLIAVLAFGVVLL